MDNQNLFRDIMNSSALWAGDGIVFIIWRYFYFDSACTINKKEIILSPISLSEFLNRRLHFLSYKMRSLAFSFVFVDVQFIASTFQLCSQSVGFDDS